MPFTPDQEQQLDNIQGQEQQLDPGGPKQQAPAKQQAKVVQLPIPGGEKPAPAAPSGPVPQTLLDNLLASKSEGTSGAAQNVPEHPTFQPKPGQDNFLLRAQ